MALNTSLLTAITGLNASSQKLDVAGNNIANVNTTAFKSSRINFETQISQNLASGSAPNGELGGTNPAQVGLGARLSGIQKDFTNGGLETTGVNTDAAIEGDGFFVVNDNGSNRFTRNGNFSQDENYDLVTASGGYVQGYGVDDDFNINKGTLQNLNIPIGSLTIAERTENVNFAGNLNAGGEVATQGTILQTQPLFAGGGAAPAAAGTALAGLEDGSGNTLFNTGDILTLSGGTKGGATLPDKTFEIGAAGSPDADASGGTVGDFMDFLNNVLGIDETTTGGVSIDGAGAINVQGNPGTANALKLDNSAVIVNAGGASPQTPIQFTQTQEADGESVRTTFTAYDSLGEPLDIDLSLVLEDKTNAGTQWRFYAQSEDDSDLDRTVSTGTLNFGTQGQFLGAADAQAGIDRNGTGAFTPQSVNLNFANEFGSVTALYDVDSQIAATSQDGSPKGTLEDFSISQDGTIVGEFSNSLTRNLGQVALATFANNNGLKETGGSLYTPSANSGEPRINAAGTGGAGRIVGRTLEGSNVDLSEQFVDLISASTGFSANSRVISTSQQLIQQLLAVVQ